MSLKDQIKQKTTELETLKNNVKVLRAKIEADGDKASGEDRTKLNAMVDDGMKMREELTRLENEETLLTQTGEPEKPKGVDLGRGSHGYKSPGQIVVESEQFKQNDGRNFRPVKLGAIPWTARQQKDIYLDLTTAGGYLTVNDRQEGILDIARQAPLAVLDLIPRVPTTLDVVEYVLMDAIDNQAAVQAAYSGAYQSLAKSNMTFDVKTATIGTYGTYVLASMQILQDVPRLRALIDNELTYMVGKKLEEALVTAFLAWSGIQTRVHAVSGGRFTSADTMADSIRRAITDLALEMYQADGIIINPAQGEALELSKDDAQQYLKIYDATANRLWRVPAVETAAMTAGTALVGQFKLGTALYDRMDTQILTGQPEATFYALAWAVLAYVRAGFAITRPLAVEKITGLA